MSERSVFSTRAVVALGGAMMVLFAASLLLSGRGGGAVQGDLTGPSSYSRSAVGYIALYDSLKTLGLKVVRADSDVLAKLGPDGVLALAEPPGLLGGDDFQREMATAKTILLILPKWSVEADPHHSGWIASATMIPAATAQAALFSVDAKPEIVRLPAPATFRVNLLTSAPSLKGTAQLAHGANLKPILATDEGILLGEIRSGTRRIVVLADPDAIENHGIGQRDNANFARDLFNFLGGAKANFVFDETIHGFHGGLGAGEAPSTLLLRFPLNLVLLQALVGLALLGGATIGRFGAPQVPPRPLGQGKRGLIANIASLIDYGGHHGDSLKAYVEAVARDAAQALKAPANLDRRGLAAWLDRTGEARGARRRCSAILDSAAQAGANDVQRLLEAAQAIHEWKEEVLDGIS
jgi:hypothetical protein